MKKKSLCYLLQSIFPSKGTKKVKQPTWKMEASVQEKHVQLEDALETIQHTDKF